MEITAVQFKAARALLGLNSKQSAKLIGVSSAFVSRVECGHRPGVALRAKMIAEFERRGIEFIGSTGVNFVGKQTKK